MQQPDQEDPAPGSTTDRPGPAPAGGSPAEPTSPNTDTRPDGIVAGNRATESDDGYVPV